MRDSCGDGQSFRLRPKSGGTIFVFNTIPPGMFSQVKGEIETLTDSLQKEGILIESELFVAFGPFDNVVRFDVDDFCLVNNISSLQGVSAQQIHCAYTIWDSALGQNKRNGFEKPFCCITQLKIQNHLMLECGADIEESVAELLKEKLNEYLENGGSEIEIELMGALGWEEFIIVLRNARGYESLFRPVVEKIRGLTLEDIEPFLSRRGFGFEFQEGVHPRDKHLFITTYSTPTYGLELCDEVESYLEQLLEGKDKPSIISKKDLEIDTLFAKNKHLPADFGKDTISVSTRLSIKPGHLREVREIIFTVLDRTDKKARKKCDDLFSMGRYDIYPWLGEEMTCRDFVALFELLRYALGGNLKRRAAYQEYLHNTRYYNSYTVISLIGFSEEPYPSGIGEEVVKTGDHIFGPYSGEGIFVDQLNRICLGITKKGNLVKTFESSEVLKNKVPTSIAIGLARIFSLFDSCIIDRFMCDTFLDMYPFMRRIRDIIDTVRPREGEPGVFEFVPSIGGEKTSSIQLRESRKRYVQDPLVTVFHTAIQLFYRGFVNRYLSSYPMMDKNESSIDFSGRLHRILSAVTGMQNLLLDDLNCHLQKGFNVISTYPNIRIHRGSFNIIESNVFHLFQIEMFYSVHHEIMHTFIHSDTLHLLRERLNDMIHMAPEGLSSASREDISLLIQELIGDVFLLKNGFYNSFPLYAFWYWLLLIQSKKDVDSHILLRFLLLFAVKDKPGRDCIFKHSKTADYFDIEEPGLLNDIIDESIGYIGYPGLIREEIISKIKNFYNQTLDNVLRERLVTNFSILLPAIESIDPLLEDVLSDLSYPGTEKIDSEKLWQDMPLIPVSGEDKTTGRQTASIRMFRGILTFIYENRKQMISPGNGLLNFSISEPGLRERLFQYRIALINTLQWEALQWKKKLLVDNGINFHIQVKPSEKGTSG